MRRSGFTLIELLVVIVIIAILVGLLFPAIRGAVDTAKEAKVVVELSQIDSALVQFKTRFGITPPSFIVLYEQGEGQGNPDWGVDTTSGLSSGARRTSRAAIRQMWPDFDFTYNNGSIDINNDGDTADVLALNGSECLMFFLGGVTGKTTVNGRDRWQTLGFSATPNRPFYPSVGNRIGPFLEFDSGRTVDIDSDGMPEYTDSFPGQSMPIQYLSSYDGSGYRPYGLDYNPATGINLTIADDELMTEGKCLQRMYYESPSFSTGDPIPSNATPFAGNTYQIISPGIDGDFGFGGYVGAGSGQPKETSDNLANFSGGRLK